MSRQFTACKGKTLCIEDTAGCRGCGRTLDEIHTTRRLVDELANFIVDMDYDNVDEFMNYFVSKVVKKANYLDDGKRRAVSNGCH